MLFDKGFLGSKKWNTSEIDFVSKNIKKITIEGDFEINTDMDLNGCELIVNGDLTINANIKNAGKIKCSYLNVNENCSLTQTTLDKKEDAIDAVVITLKKNASINAKDGTIHCLYAKIDGTITAGKLYMPAGKDYTTEVTKYGSLHIPVIETAGHFLFKSEVFQGGNFLKGNLKVGGNLTIQGKHFQHEGQVSVGGYIKTANKNYNHIENLSFTTPALIWSSDNNRVIWANDISKQDFNASSVCYISMDIAIKQYLENKILNSAKKYVSSQVGVTSNIKVETYDDLNKALKKAYEAVDKEISKYKDKKALKEYVESRGLKESPNKLKVETNEITIMGHTEDDSAYKNAVQYALNHAEETSSSTFKKGAIDIRVSSHSVETKTFKDKNGITWDVSIKDIGLFTSGHGQGTIEGYVLKNKEKSIVYPKIPYSFDRSNLEKDAKTLYDQGKEAIDDLLEEAVDSLYKEVDNAIGLSAMVKECLPELPKLGLKIGGSVTIPIGSETLKNANMVVKDIKDALADYKEEMKFFNRILDFYDAVDGFYNVGNDYLK